MACRSLVALALTSTVWASDPVVAAPDRQPLPTQVDHRWPIAGETGAIELSGLAPATSLDVDIPPGWAASGPGSLSLEYELPTLVESAAIATSLNGELVDAVALPSRSGTVEVELPAERFRGGRNKVVIEASIEIVDDRDCPEPWHPARVLTFGAGSGVEVPLEPVGPLTLDQLPGALEPVGVERRVVTVRLAPAPSAEDLSAAAAVVAALRGDAALDVAIEVADLQGVGADGPDILIGVAADLAAAGHDVADAPGGILRIGRNRSSNTRLVVTGSTPADVLAAARAIGSAPRSPIQVGIEPGEDPVPPAPVERFTLADLGYPDRELTGPGVESTVYGFDAPISVAPTSMTVTIDAVRSASADEVSGVSVHVNGSRVGTVHFDVDTGATSGVQINVSGDDVRPGRNFLRVDVEFHGPPIDCDQRPPDESVEISSSTGLELITSEDSVAIDLEDLPYLLRAPNDSANLVVVLPEDPTRLDLQDAIDIAATYGDERFPARIALAGDLDAERLVGRHVIALGGADEQPLHELIPDSIVATHADMAEAGVSAVGGSASLDGVIEVVPNPVDPTRAVMLATGFDREGADLAQRVLLDERLRGELYGRATFVGGTPESPLLAPVLEPVRIFRGEPAADVDAAPDVDLRPARDDDDDLDATPVGDGTILNDPPDLGSSGLGSFPLELAVVVLIALGAAVAGAVVLVRRRRHAALAAAS